MASEIKIPDSFRDTIRLLSKTADLYHYLLTHLNTILETHSQSMVYIQLGVVTDKTKNWTAIANFCADTRIVELNFNKNTIFVQRYLPTAS